MVAIPVKTDAPAPATIPVVGPNTICDDRCPAHALEAWMSEASGFILFFCRHHGRQHAVTLVRNAFTIVEAANPE